jgi:hypothetical protein
MSAIAAAAAATPRTVSSTLSTDASSDLPKEPAGHGHGIPAKVGLPLLLGMLVVGNVAVFGNFSPRTTALMGAGLAGVGAAAAGWSMLDPDKSGGDKAMLGVAGLSSLAIAGMALKFGLSHH